jgi:biopolymer transport protein ExbB
MEWIITFIESYMKTGGITMYPLVLCCLWMWGIIFYHLPFWQKTPDPDMEGIQKRFLQLKTGCPRHDRALVYFLQGRAEQKTAQPISTIKVIATLAPFLGLFGTVTGMIKAFQSVARFGLVNSKGLAGGISEAMVTTQFGLFIAVPGIIAVVYLKRNAARRQAKIEEKTRDLLSENG